jgi:hypothetical protein
VHLVLGDRLVLLQLLDLACAILTSDLRRSSVSAGIVSRITLPSLFGVSPRFDLSNAFSTSASTFGSQGAIVIVVGSGTDSEAT